MIKRTISYICTIVLLVWAVSVTGTIALADNADGHMDTETVQDEQEENFNAIVPETVYIDTGNPKGGVVENASDGSDVPEEQKETEDVVEAEEPEEAEKPTEWQGEEDYGGTEADNQAEEMIYEEVSVEKETSEATVMSEEKKIYNLTFKLYEYGEVIKTIQVEAGAVCSEAEDFIPSRTVPKDKTGIEYIWRIEGSTKQVGNGFTMPEEDLAVYVYTSNHAKDWEKEEKDGKIIWKYTKSSEEIVIEVDGHNWNEGEVKEPPTCTEPGTKLYTCTDEDCNETKTETIPANGHTEGPKAEDKPVSCTEDGYIGGTICSVCGDVMNAGTVKATGHSDSNSDGVCDVCSEKIYDLNTAANSTSYKLKSNSNTSPLRVNLGVKNDAVPADLTVSLERGADSRDLVKNTDYTVALSDEYYWDVTLLPAGLETLEAGEYTVSIQWGAGNDPKTAKGSLIVSPAEEKKPENPGGDNPSTSENNGNNSSTEDSDGSDNSNASAEITVMSIAPIISNTPKTGDETNMIPWLILSVLSGIGFVIICVSERKHRIK